MNSQHRSNTSILLACAASVAVTACSDDRDLPVADVDCRTGLYEAANGEQLALTPLYEGKYRWRMPDGKTGAIRAQDGISTLGWTDEPDGWVAALGPCDEGGISLGPAGAERRFERTELEIHDSSFVSEDVEFAGRLVWPKDKASAHLAILIHGSEMSSALRRNPMPYLLAAQGIASFVYDKRGTGSSDGSYTQDFHLLATDARAALEEARRLAGDRILSKGYIGASQGGWVAPLAASQSDADFVVVLFGLAVNALAEDRSEVIAGLARAGWGAEEQAEGAALADAAGVIMASEFSSGYDEFDRLRDLYKDEAWYEDVVGEFTGQLLPHPALALRLFGSFYSVGTSWGYEPVPVLQSLTQPQFWMIAADDEMAPSLETIRRLRSLQGEGVAIDLAVYPDAGHGMVQRERSESGEVREVAYVEDYYRQIAAWIQNRDLSHASRAGARISSLQSAAGTATP